MLWFVLLLVLVLLSVLSFFCIADYIGISLDLLWKTLLPLFVSCLFVVVTSGAIGDARNAVKYTLKVTDT